MISSPSAMQVPVAVIDRYTEMLEPLADESGYYGLASIDIGEENSFHGCLGIKTVNGLSEDGRFQHCPHFIGYIDFVPDNASRSLSSESVPNVPESVLNNWAGRQMKKLVEMDASKEELHFGCHSLCALRQDPYEIACVPGMFPDGKVSSLTMEEIIRELENKPILMYISDFGDHVDQYVEIKPLPNTIVVFHKANSAFGGASLDGGKPVNNSYISCLNKYADSKQIDLQWIQKNSDMKSIHRMKVTELIIKKVVHKE